MKIAFLGDCVINSDPFEISLSSEIIDILKDCDISCVNFEAPILTNKVKGIHKSGPNLSQNCLTPAWLEKNNINLINLANNHALDYGEEALIFTINSFKKAEVIGYGNYYNAYDVKIIEINKEKIGFLPISHTEFGCVDHYSMSKMGVPKATSPKVMKSIVEVRNKVDKLYILSHAGIEYIDAPLPEWRELYKVFIDLGVDGVIGSHPHVPQGIEYYKNKPIIYSLGNFIFELKNSQNYPTFWYNSLLVVINHSSDKVNVYPLVYSQTEKKVNIDNSEKTKEHLKYLNQLLENQSLYINYIETVTQKNRIKYDNLVKLGIENFDLYFEIKNLIKRCLGRKILKKDRVHLLNLLQCESHRWLLENIIKNKKESN